MPAVPAGLELTTTHARLAAAGSIVAEVALPEGAIVSGDIADAAALARALKELPLAGRPVRAGLCSPRTTTRTLALEGAPAGPALAAAVAERVAGMLPVSLDELVLGHAVLPSAAPDVTRVLVVAAPRDQVLALAAALDAARAGRVEVDVAGPALAGAAGDGTQLVVEAGPLTTLCVSEAGHCAFARTSRAGTAAIAAALAEAQGVEAAVAARHVAAAAGASGDGVADALLSLARDALTTAAGQVVAEVRSSLDFHRRGEGAGAVQGILLTGEAAGWPGLAAMLQQELGLPTDVRPGSAGQVAAALSRGPVVALPVPAALRERPASGGRWAPRAAVAAGALLAAASVGTAVAGNRVEDRRAALTVAEQRRGALEQQVAALAPAADLAQRRATLEGAVRRVLQRRFDWHGALEGVAGAAAGTVELSALRGTLEPGAARAGGGLRSANRGPALELAGCAATVDAVSRFLVRLEELPGVAEVALDSTRRSGDERACDAPQRFAVVAWFDAAVPPIGALR